MSYLSQLEILCDLYVEHDTLLKFIAANGYTYRAVGRQGISIKSYPQVAQMNRVKSEIRSYSKMLGLVLTRDKELRNAGEEEAWE